MNNSSKSTRKAKETRSKVSNGSALFISGDVDGRSAQARRFRDLYEEMISALGDGAEVGEPERQRCRRAEPSTSHQKLK